MRLCCLAWGSPPCILWDVVDAINKTPAVGAFYFPQDEEGCIAHAERFKVW